MTGNTLWRRWCSTVADAPHKIILVNALTGETVTARELEQRAIRLSESALAPCCGRAVAYQSPNGVDWLTLFLALQRLRSAAVPLEPDTQGARASEAAARRGAHFLWEDGRLTRLAPERIPRPRTSCVKSTSGSTGHPRPVDCLSSHLLADGTNIIATMGLLPSDRNLALIPFGHSYGLGNLVMPLVLRGVALICAPEFVPQQIPEWMARHAVTVFPSVPVVFQLLVDAPSISCLAPLRLAISAGSPLKGGTARHFFEKFGIPLHNFYGSSETGGIAYDISGHGTAENGVVGHPMQGVQVEILEGQVHVRSQAVAMPGHSYTLPDHGSWNERGELRLNGRAWMVANIGGNKVNPAEIERFLRSFPEVGDVWMGVFQTDQRDYLGAAVETALNAEELRHRLCHHLPGWKIPRLLVSCPKLPRNPQGKVDASAVRDLLLGS